MARTIYRLPPALGVLLQLLLGIVLLVLGSAIVLSMMYAITNPAPGLERILEERARHKH